MKILLFGKNGQLGWELNRTLLCLGELIAVDYPEIDFEKTQKVRKLLEEIKPDLIINAVAYTDVDMAEQEPKRAYMVNTLTPAEIADWCKKNYSVFIHYSTDYVFDGSKCSPYNEEDKPNPINTYGKTKLEGERAIQESGAIYLILRTAWVYSKRGKNFVTKILDWAKKTNELRVVDDQISNPTCARSLAEITADIIVKGIEDIRDFFKERSSILHCAGSGYCSRYDWALTTIKICFSQEDQERINLVKAKTSDFSTPAQRPLFSALNCERFYQIFKIRLPNWDIALRLEL